MRINYALNERTVHRAFKQQPRGRRSLFVFDRDLPRNGFRHRYWARWRA